MPTVGNSATGFPALRARTRRTRILWQSLMGTALAIAITWASASEKNETMGRVFVQVDAVQLDNRGKPTGYRKELVGFSVMNLDTRRRYAESAPHGGGVSLLQLPPARYCLHAVRTYANEELYLCRPPYFEAKAGGLSNVGKWQTGVSYPSGTYRLMHAFEEQAAVEQQARDRFHRVFAPPTSPPDAAGASSALPESPAR